jgi:acyl dehydratase
MTFHQDSERKMENSMIQLFNEPNILSSIGTEIGKSNWIKVTQELITNFGHLTKDPDLAHIDPEWAKQNSPFGTTIAFGFLTVSLLTTMLNGIVARPEDEVSTLNYGFDRLRFLSPVLVGAEIRGCFELKAIELRSPTQFKVTYGVIIEIAGSEKPAMLADWLCITNVANARTLHT